MSSEKKQSKVVYQCQLCAKCCKWPGDVVLEDGEAEKIAEYIGMEFYDFVAKYTRLRANRSGLSLIEKENDECIFLENNRCAINDVKPVQCSGFPNTWNFPGWRDCCEAIPIPVEE